jgi:hypothetical protein
MYPGLTGVVRVKHALLIIVLVVCNVVPCRAADAPASPTSLAEVIAVACPAFVQPILSNPLFDMALRHRPIVLNDICKCGVTRALNDSVVSPLKDLPYRDLNARLQNDTSLQAYVLSRALQSIMQCYSEEIDSRLNESKAKLAGG